MGFFGILVEDGDEFEVQRFDINLWCLPTTLRAYRHCCDVGIELTPKTRVAGLTLALPFKSSDTFVDLGPLLRRPQIASLIFGEPVNVLGDKVLEIGTRRLRLAHVTPESKLDDLRSSSTISLWKIQFASGLKEPESWYVRLARSRSRGTSALA